MKKKSPQKKSSTLKKIVVIVILLLLVAGGVKAYEDFSGKKSLSIINNWIEEQDDSKEDDVGCCLPHCAETKQIVCEQSAGGSWKKGS